MVKYILAPIKLLLTGINLISVHTLKFLSFITNFISTLTMIFVIGVYSVDKFMAGGYYADTLVNELIARKQMVLFYEFSNFLEKHTALTIAVFCIFVISIIIGKKALKKLWTTKKLKYNIISNIAFVIINLFANIFVITITALFINNIMITGYVNSYKIDNIGNYEEKIEFINTHIEENRHMATIALNKIIFDINSNPDFLSKLTMEEHLNLCKEINFLIDLQNGPTSIEEHFLRNKLNYAPKTLTKMLEEIRNGNEYGINWILMKPETSALHMFGKDGEYNLKFVSEDGCFEAVYNKKGELLTEENNPKNMGTYNFAHPSKEAKKHALYDVAPYYIWGNTPEDHPQINSEVIINLEMFNENPEAMEKYESVKYEVIKSTRNRKG